MTLSSMIKRKYLAEKVIEQTKTGSFHERRAYPPFWRKRIGSTHAWHHDHSNGSGLVCCDADLRGIPARIGGKRPELRPESETTLFDFIAGDII